MLDNDRSLSLLPLSPSLESSLELLSIANDTAFAFKFALAVASASSRNFFALCPTPPFVLTLTLPPGSCPTAANDGAGVVGTGPLSSAAGADAFDGGVSPDALSRAGFSGQSLKLERL